MEITCLDEVFKPQYRNRTKYKLRFSKWNTYSVDFTYLNIKLSILKKIEIL